MAQEVERVRSPAPPSLRVCRGVKVSSAALRGYRLAWRTPLSVCESVYEWVNVR